MVEHTFAVKRDDISTGKQIARFGHPYHDICQWASQHDLSDALELAFWTLGLDHQVVAIGNLVNEFHHPESKDILARWRQNPIVALLDDLSKAIRQDPLINRQYPALPHSGSAAKTKDKYKGSLKEQTFLITLITYPLPGTEQSSEYESRRALRLWLVAQAAHRVLTNYCLADRNISTAARFLIADRYQEQWQLVDDVLRRARRYLTPETWTFERFTDALFLAAEQYKQSHTFGKSGTAFINAIIEIASGDIKPFTTQRDFPPQPFVHAELSAPISEPTPLISFDESSEQFIEVCPSPGDLTDEEAEEAIYLLPVDSTDTQAQQELTGRSFYHQQVETSHYLPWSYSKLLPPERLVVEEWMAQQLTHTDDKERLGGALVWLAIRFSRSLSQVLAMDIADAPQGEWSLSSTLQQMHRLSPRRRNAWKPDVAAQSYIAAVHEKQRVVLDTELTAAFVSGRQRLPAPASLAELWQSVSPGQKVEVWFNARMSAVCSRVTSGRLAEVWGQSVFEVSGNHHFARMLTAHPNSALPGACSYTSWDIEAIEQGLALPYQFQGAETLQSTNQGSLLVPLEAQLNGAISEATQQLKETLEGNELVRLHNQWASYCVMALYAATGSRYLKDPFESPRFFNHYLPAVFINDKAEGSGVRNGRMVPLADKALEFAEAYLSYLQRLAEHLLTTHPAVSSRINALLEAPEKAEQPLFFLLDESLNWHSMSATDLPSVPLFDWPLPPNLFRHRLAQQLPLLGVDNEVVDGWLGHAEKSVATYGDTSARCWMDDWTAYRKEVNELFEQLPFDLLSLPATLPLAPVSGLRDSATPSRAFGQRLREKNRRLATRNVIRAALNDIDLFLKGRDIAALSADEINQLGRQMLLQQGKTPYPSAALRFSVLTRLLERHESPHRHAFQRRYIPMLPEKTLIHEHAPVYTTLMTHLMQWATKVRPHATRVHCSKRQALAIGALLLCIEKRICYTRLLNDVCQGDNFRLLYHRKTYYLEYSEQLDRTSWQAPVQRHQISYHVASLLTYGQHLTSTKTLDDHWTIPKQAPPLPDAFIQCCAIQERMTIQQVIEQAAGIVDQANLLGLPGVVAGALAGRIVATSLPMQAHIRMAHGKSLVFPQPPVSSEHSVLPATLPALLTASGDKYELQQQTLLLFKEVKQLLDGYTKPQARETAKSLEKLVTQRNGQVSSAIMLLVIWIATVIRIGKGRAGRRFKPFESSSIHRYWGALRKLFEELAYGVDLMALGSEEVTAFYAGLIDYQETQLSDMSYFSHRLRSFHRVAVSLGVEEPDWDELPVAEQGRHVRAEMISEREYLEALKQIGATQRDLDIACLLQFILLCAYRFGLRLDEARGLLRRDWCESHGYCWVLIRNNRYRTLKSEASRRAVPLLFSLDAIEQRTINAVINRHDALLGGEASMPLLGEVRDGKVDIALSASAISAAEIDVLRHVSGSPILSLHHARHAFYNITVAALLQLNTPVATKITQHIDSDNIRQMVMGQQQHHCSRRVMMGLARLMGHRQPSTGLLNYNHLILEWADMLTPVKGTNGGILKEAIKPQDFKRYTPASTPPQDLPLFNEPTPYLLMKALRLGALRQNVRRAGEALGLFPGHAAILEGVVKAAENNMRFKVRGKDQWVTSQDYPLGLLRSINDAAWNRLLEHASEIDVETLATYSDELEFHELACQVGRHRHLLMSEARHVEVIALTVKAFKVPQINYEIVGKSCSDDINSMLKSYGLKEISNTDIQLDMFEVVKGGREMKYQQYAGLLLTKNESGVVRNRYELAVAYIMTAVYSYLRKNVI
ncbi:hypothetical protein [Vreelandella titanicae]|uniref:Uncharacterized protein n=1 Tax=Vreelandella titanicae TaxID=664683 RepID=A0AAP9NQI8_9GAMM|nr:hypothetical protein [Halomonas titanicae]QKS26729.1 hypothetical protein FX987_04545 [Halomonas titanicae]